jgi:hypothetical protein
VSRVLFAAVFACAASAHAQTAYFAAIEDLPLPPGFAEREPAPGFAGDGGRITLAFAEGDLAGLAVRDFYYEVLPQLGWSVSPQPDGALVFQRGRERLSFTLENIGGRTRLGARLAVLPASMDAD